MSTMIQSEYSIQINASYTQKTRAANIPRPIWDPKKVYNYLEDMGEGFKEYKQKAINYYRSEFTKSGTDGPISVDALKDEIKKYMPEYTFTKREPKDPIKGKYYLYIDDSQLNKMASDPAYRARVFGLMDSELQGKNGYTLKYTSGKNVTNYIAGSIFSLAEANRSIEGVGQMLGSEAIPYYGSAVSNMSCSTDGRAQVRSQAYIDQILHPGKCLAAKHSGRTLSDTSSAKERAAQYRKEHKLKLQMEYKQWLEDKTKADELQERFLTDLNASDVDISIFDSRS